MGRFGPRYRTMVAASLVALGCAAGGGAGHAQTGRTMIEYEELTSAFSAAPAADLREPYGDDTLQFGELRLPRDVAGRRPVIVLLHGGCWQASYDLRYMASAAVALAREGYVVWTPEYRRLGDAGGGWPGTFDDVARAIDHLRSLAARVPQIDTARVVLAGHSAGGQLALWAASRKPGDGGPDLVAANRAPLRVLGVVSLAGITDLATYGDGSGGCNRAVTPLMGGTPAQMPERYRAVSPIERLPLGVPIRFVHGVADPLVPIAQSEQYAVRARGAGDHAEVAAIRGAGHFDVVAPQATAWAAVVAAVRAIAPPTSSP